MKVFHKKKPKTYDVDVSPILSKKVRARRLVPSEGQASTIHCETRDHVIEDEDRSKNTKEEEKKESGS